MILVKNIVMLTVATFLNSKICSAFLWDKEMEVLQSEWSDSPVVLRHVEFIGEVDNGTLDCFVPGIREYKWTLLAKGSSGGPFTSTIRLGLRPFRKTAWSIKIYPALFDGDILVALCEPQVESVTQLRLVWVLTKLHSPLGYPTDPRICDFGSSDIKKNCLWYWWKFRTDCFHDKGQDYRGSVRKTASDRLCQSWENAKPDVYKENKYMDRKGDHNHCRNPSPDTRRIPWCYYYNPRTNEPVKESCRVAKCSDCMYGVGDGTFHLYSKRKFPKYSGGTLDTFKVDNKMRIVKCFQGKYLNNFCRLYKGVTGPHCYTPKNPQDVKDIDSIPHPKLELTKCAIFQCTVRQVWFLFIDSLGNPNLLGPSNSAFPIDLIKGKRNVEVKFAAFGVHKLDGLSIDTTDFSLKAKAKQFKISFRSPPEKLSIIQVPYVDKMIEGEYFLRYEFAEADTKIQQNHFKGKFMLKVKNPTSFKILPTVLKVCQGEKASFKLNVEGDFSPLDESIRWSYGYSRAAISKIISLDDQLVRRISPDLRSLTIVAKTQDTWIAVEGKSYSGRAKAIGQLKIKGMFERFFTVQQKSTQIVSFRLEV